MQRLALASEPYVAAAIALDWTNLAALGGVPERGMTDRGMDDRELVRRAGAGDASAFRQIFQRHRVDVARLVYRMLPASPSDHDDVVQEVFVQVFRSLKDFRGDAKLSTWMHRVTVNVVLMHRRAQKSRPQATAAMPELTTSEPGPDEEAARHERMRAFQRLVDRLAEKKRVVFVLHDLEGLAPAAIAEIVGAPVLTVRTRLFYARREIEAMMGEEPSLAALESRYRDGGDEASAPAAPASRGPRAADRDHAR